MKFLTKHRNILKHFDKFHTTAYLTLYSLGSNFDPTGAKYIVGNLKKIKQNMTNRQQYYDSIKLDIQLKMAQMYI